MQRLRMLIHGPFCDSRERCPELSRSGRGTPELGDGYLLMYGGGRPCQKANPDRVTAASSESGCPAERHANWDWPERCFPRAAMCLAGWRNRQIRLARFVNP